jgi:hypothetical protein
VEDNGVAGSGRRLMLQAQEWRGVDSVTGSRMMMPLWAQGRLGVDGVIDSSMMASPAPDRGRWCHVRRTRLGSSPARGWGR